MQGFILCALSAVLWGQQPATTDAPSPDEVRKRQLEQFASDAAKYEVTLETSKPQRLEFLRQPILNWDGSAFVWLKDGRPEVIGALWTNVNPRSGRKEYGHAFHSLSEHPLTAKFDSQLVWSPTSPGLRFQPVEGAHVADADSRRRSVQLRSLAREFSAVQWKGGRKQLRMLTQPIFRY
jgi:hypothetical protein